MNGAKQEEFSATVWRFLARVADYDLRHVFRALRECGRQESSWFITRKGSATGRYFDRTYPWSKRVVV